MTSSEVILFVEFDEVCILIDGLVFNNDNSETPNSMVNDEEIPSNDESETTTTNGAVKTMTPSDCDKSLRRLRIIFDKYLECPSLLDPYLERICVSLSGKARDLVHSIYELSVSSFSTTTTTSSSSKIDTEDTEEIPADEVIQDMEAQINAILSNLKRILSTLYSLSKVRGKKQVQRFFTHDACDVEPVLFTLRYIGDGNNKGNITDEAKTWESTYSSLLWLGMLSLVPFDLNTIDSSITSSSHPRLSTADTNMSKSDTMNKQAQNIHAHHPSNSTTLISSMLQICKSHLHDSGSTRDVACMTLSALLSRPDLEETELEDFVQWSNSILEEHLSGTDQNNLSSIFLLLGVVQTLASIFKTGSRSNLMQRHLRCIELLWEKAILVAEKSSPTSQDGMGNTTGGTLLLRKFLVKLFARVGCAYLPPRIANWRYQRGRRSLLENLETVSTVTSATAKTTTKAALSSHNEESKDDDIFEVADQVEDSMAQLIQSLTDPATTVRWSCAKGIGRVTERLPSICADDVLDSLLELCQDDENDNAWHGACLALAELARRGLLLPKRLDEVVPMIIRAIQFDIPRGQHSVGAHVRDAACYTCWAFARAYAPSILKPYVAELSKAIVLSSLFDREINCRRAASASFQECVGRQGAGNFKHGITIITTADYFSLGNRADAFTTVAFKIAKFDEYRRPIIDHLSEIKLFHWDLEIRTIASKSLHGLTSLDHDYFATKVVPELIESCIDSDLAIRHGAILGVAEIILALGYIRDGKVQQDTMQGVGSEDLGISSDIAISVAELVPRLEKLRLYRGRGGEIMRSAASRLIECLSIAKVPLTVKQQIRLLGSLDDNLKHPNEDIQVAAANALSSLMVCYFPVSANGPSDRLQDRVVNNYIEKVSKEANPAWTRGFALALGHLPPKLFPNSDVLDSVINCLCKASHFNSLVGGEKDAETRRNAIQSLVKLCETVGMGSTPRSSSTYETYPSVGLNERQVSQVFEALLDGTKDYNTDRRGDVGSWTRKVAMKGLETITFLAISSSPDIPQIHTHQSNATSLTSRHQVSTNRMPSYDKRLHSFEINASDRVIQSLTNKCSFRPRLTDQVSKIFFDDITCKKVLGAILKQLSEKLDTVRDQAGKCIERLLLGTTPVVPFVPCRQILMEALNLHRPQSRLEKNSSAIEEEDSKSRDQINWANPSETFPLLMRAVNIDAFFTPIIAGCVISIGGMTESVTKCSTKSILDYLRSLQHLKANRQIVKIGSGK